MKYSTKRLIVAGISAIIALYRRDTFSLIIFLYFVNQFDFALLREEIDSKLDREKNV